MVYENRSYLFVPALKKSMIKKAIASHADAVIIDLEDSVALSQKQKARETILEALQEIENLKEIFIRINDLQTPFWEEDISCAIRAQVDGIVLPKATSSEDVNMVHAKVEAGTHRSSSFDFKLIPLIETAKGIQNAYEIACATQGVERLAFGSIDYSLDIDCQLTPGGLELLFARSQIVNASRAAGVGPPVDAVFPDLEDEEGLKKEAQFARQVGFKSKLMIHPKQIEAVHLFFSPSQAEVENCKEIVDAFEKAEQQGNASISYKNKLVDYPVYLKAKKLLEMDFQ